MPLKKTDFSPEIIETMNIVQNKIDIQQIFGELFLLFILLTIGYSSARLLESTSIFYVISIQMGVLLAIYAFVKEEYGIIPLIILFLFSNLVAKNMYGIKALNAINLIYLAILAKIFLNLMHTSRTSIPKVSFLAPLMIFFILEVVAGARCATAERLPMDLNLFLTYFLKPLQCLSIIFIVFFSLKRESSIERIFLYISIASILVSCYYIFVVKTQLGHLTVHSQIIHSKFALGSIQGSAFAIGTLTPVLLLYFYHSTTRMIKSIVLCSLVISTYFIFYSFSRTLYLSVFISLAYVVYKTKKRNFIHFTCAMIVFIFLAPNLTINRIVHGAGDHFRNLNEYSSSRLFTWNAVADYIGDHLSEIIVFGKGEGAFESSSSNYGAGVKRKDMVNMYLSLFVRNGILGIILLTWMAFAIFKESKFIYNKSKSLLVNVTAIGVNAILIQILVQGLTTDLRFFERGKIMLMILLGIMIWFKGQYNRESVTRA